MQAEIIRTCWQNCYTAEETRLELSLYGFNVPVGTIEREFRNFTCDAHDLEWASEEGFYHAQAA